MGDPSERSRLFRVRAPSPATVIAVIALVFAMAGGAIAATGVNQGPVAVVTTKGGPATVTGATADPNNGGQLIPVANPTFTQKAGQVVLVAGELNVTGTNQGEQNCDLEVTVAG